MVGPVSGGITFLRLLQLARPYLLPESSATTSDSAGLDNSINQKGILTSGPASASSHYEEQSTFVMRNNMSEISIDQGVGVANVTLPANNADNSQILGGDISGIYPNTSSVRHNATGPTLTTADSAGMKANAGVRSPTKHTAANSRLAIPKPGKNVSFSVQQISDDEFEPSYDEDARNTQQKDPQQSSFLSIPEIGSIDTEQYRRTNPQRRGPTPITHEDSSSFEHSYSGDSGGDGSDVSSRLVAMEQLPDDEGSSPGVGNSASPLTTISERLISSQDTFDDSVTLQSNNSSSIKRRSAQRSKGGLMVRERDVLDSDSSGDDASPQDQSPKEEEAPDSPAASAPAKANRRKPAGMFSLTAVDTSGDASSVPSPLAAGNSPTLAKGFDGDISRSSPKISKELPSKYKIKLC